MTNSKIITLTPLNNSGDYTPIKLGLAGNAVYSQAAGGSGGWQIVDRPKRTGATQWFDRSPWSLSFDGILNSTITNNKSTFAVTGENNVVGVENDCTRLESWLSSVPGTLEPPVFSVSGPVPGIHHAWCMQTIEFGDAVRHETQGFRYQQNVKIVLYEYSPPFANSYSAFGGSISPTDSYYYTTETIATSGTSFQAYSVGEGETIASIAAKFNLGKVKVSQLLTMNNIRDPRNIQQGQTLLLPN